MYFLLIICFVFSTRAQHVIFNRFTQPEGSFSGIVNGISQDPLGYMWFAVYDRGLYRSDGYHLVPYQHDPSNPGSLATNAIEPVYADRNGIIWVGTQDSGLDRLDPNTGIFSHFRHKANDKGSLSDNRVKTILEDHEGILWVGTMNGLNKMDQKTGTFTRYLYDPEDPTTLSWNQVQVLYEDRQKTLWVGTASFEKETNRSAKEGGLNRFDRKTGKFTRFFHNSQDPHSLIDNRVGAIFEDSKGNFWVSTVGDGLHSMDRQTGKFERLCYDPTHPRRLSGPPRKKDVNLDIDLFFIQEDGSGSIWIGASGGWITRYDPTSKKVTHYDSFNGDTQSMQQVSGGFASRDGTLWITTWKDDVYKVDPFYSTIPHFITGSIVHAIHEDVSGDLWIGTLGKGLVRTNRSKGSTKRFVIDSAAPSSMWNTWITALYGEDDSTLWIGSWNHLNCFDRRRHLFTRFTNDPQDETSLSKGWIVAISADQPGWLWISTEEGLDHLDTKTKKFTHYRNNPKDSNSLSHNAVTSLLKDHSGNLWVGTRYGILNRFDSRTKKFKRFPCRGNIGSIVEDSDNIVWVGTSNGLYRSNPAVDTFSLFTDPGFMLTATTMITGILEDNQKNLWIASSAGIFSFNPKRNTFTVYSKYQGVDPSALSSVLMRSKKGRRGELFFGDRTGYYAFFTDQFKNNTTPPQIVISDFRLADQPVKPGKGSPLSLPLSQSKVISLNYDQNFFSFNFAGIHYSSPEDNQHLFMLENLDNSWRKASPEKKAIYYNVPPGRYIFRVRAFNSYGIWAEKAIIVIINPPWYHMWWAYVLFILVFVVSLWSFIKWRERSLKKEKVLLEEKVSVRTNELKTEKEKVESTLSELKTTQSQLLESEKMASMDKLETAMLNERLRISRELHDDIGSTLSGIVLYSHLAENQLQAEQAAQVEKSLNIIQQSANDMVNRLNDLVWAVNPEYNSLKNLVQKLEEYAKEIAIAKKIKVEVNVPERLDQIQLPVESRHNIYLLGKEAINNAVKYSDASLLELAVRQFDHVIEFSIMDNGNGFDVTKVKKGNGLTNMRKRAEDAAGILSVHSLPEGGTVISLQIKIT